MKYHSSWLEKKTHNIWVILCLAVKKFLLIDGAQWAGAFAFNAFFSLFPLIVIFITIASAFIDRNEAGKVIIDYMEHYIPISGKMQSYIFDTINGVIQVRGQVGVVAFLILVWSAIQCFITLISATNLAWGIALYNWWRLPLKSLVLLGTTAGTVLLGMAAPVLMRMAKSWLFTGRDFHFWVYDLGSFLLSLLVVFLSLNLFYKLAPRQYTRFSQVWVAALGVTVLLQAAENLFVIYLNNFAKLNALYGTFGGIMALLLWIYLSGCIFIFGACLCAAQAEVGAAPLEKQNCIQ